MHRAHIRAALASLVLALGPGSGTWEAAAQVIEVRVGAAPVVPVGGAAAGAAPVSAPMTGPAALSPGLPSPVLPSVAVPSPSLAPELEAAGRARELSVDGAGAVGHRIMDIVLRHEASGSSEVPEIGAPVAAGPAAPAGLNPAAPGSPSAAAAVEVHARMAKDPAKPPYVTFSKPPAARAPAEEPAWLTGVMVALIVASGALGWHMIYRMLAEVAYAAATQTVPPGFPLDFW